MEKYYRYKGTLLECEMGEIVIKLIEKSKSLKLKKEYQKVLADDEYIKMKFSVIDTVKDNVTGLADFVCHPAMFPLPNMVPLIVPIVNVNINVRAVTLTILAVLLDIDFTKGYLNAFLALSGFNNRAFVKIDENEGEKCILIEICSKQGHKADVHIFHNICGKECVNNNLKCKYRTEERCLMKMDEAIEKCDDMAEKNILQKEGNKYSYNILF